MYIPEIPDNSMKPQLEELLYIIGKLQEEAVNGILPMEFEFGPPATEEELTALEKALDTELPTGYKDFLRFSNGARIRNYFAEFDDTQKVAKQPEGIEGFLKDYIVLARLVGDGELLCWSKDKKKFVRYYGGEETSYNDFYEFFAWLLSVVRDDAENYVEL